MITPSYIGKIFLSLAIAFFVTSFLVRGVFYPYLPAVRPEFQQKVAESPKIAASTFRELRTRAAVKFEEVTRFIPGQSKAVVMPPPWVPRATSPAGQPPSYPDDPGRQTNPQPTSPSYPTGSYPSPTSYSYPTSPPGGQPTQPPPTQSAPTQPPPPTATNVPPTTPPSNPDLSAQEQETVNLINQKRSSMGLSTLRVVSQLASSARLHSQDISNRNCCCHYGANGSTAADRARSAGYSGTVVGETLGCGPNTPASIVEGWWNSPGHKAVLTYAGARDIGVGWYNNRQTAVVGY